MGNNRRVTGYAIIFDHESKDLGGFKEIIKPSAVDGILEKSDVLALVNHDESKGVLARSKFMNGSLILRKDSKGLRYQFDAPQTSLGDEVLEGVRRQDITTSSFSFTVSKGQTWEKRGNEYLRTITKFDEIYDVSPVYREAYSATTVELQ